MNQDCVFCKISNGDIPAKKIYENGNYFSIPDAKPMVNGHSLIISKKHYSTIIDLPSIIGQEFVDCIKNTSMKLMKEMGAEGFNLLNNNFKAAGQIVNHFHLHIIPRKNGDNFKIVG
jgi:histidine triad (HIT) family protein